MNCVISGRNLSELLEAFNRESYKLSEKELLQLEEFGKKLDNLKNKNQTDFLAEGKKLGFIFKNNPNIDNFVSLINLVNCSIIENLKIKPYLIQNLIVFSFFLHFINKSERNKFKGRLGQILTGEGKSLIIAQIALISALMGNFVDIITSTSYLAERDQIKFKELYNSFGVSSSSITAQNPVKEDYNGIILYGTNTDFEFTLLREGTFNIENNFTVPLGEKIEIKRKYQTVIVDESDNLFIDAALNSARISYKSRAHYNWVYYPIFHSIKNGIDTIENIRNELIKINKDEVSHISNNQIKNWISKAKHALELKKNKDYIVRFNERTKQKEVQIVQLSTGRISVGSRWSNGLHEFVEVKEGIIPKTENNTIASISHPSFFKNYETIFGLTGTMGSTIERNEILEIYHLDSFDAPPNFSSKRTILPTLYFENKNLKEQKILENTEILVSKGIPVLILLLSVKKKNETISFSNKLKLQGINNLILNDIQKEKEDYIIFYAGKPGSVVVATNAAGRGADIILSEEALNAGGLHVIMGFYPENSRIEFQGIGRAGRQGQKGSAQIIFSSDEEFFRDTRINNLKDAKKFREVNLFLSSQRRIISSYYEIEAYECLKLFFEMQKFLNETLDNYQCELAFHKLDNEINMTYDSFAKKVKEKFRLDWAEFFSSFTNREKKMIWNDFLRSFGWEELNANINLQKFIKNIINTINSL